MSARDVAFTLMALGHVAGCRGQTATEILAEAVGEIVRLQTALEKITDHLKLPYDERDDGVLEQIAADTLEYKEAK